MRGKIIMQEDGTRTAGFVAGVRLQMDIHTIGKTIVTFLKLDTAYYQDSLSSDMGLNARKSVFLGLQ